MKQLVLLVFLFISLTACGKKMLEVAAMPPLVERVVEVSSGTQLQKAFDEARPGDKIVMTPGTYRGKFVIKPGVHGTSQNPITLKGGRDAILDAGSLTTGYVLHLQANHWKLVGFTVTNGLKGIVADKANYNIIDSVMVTRVGEEGIHLRKFSSNNTITKVEITHTGLTTPDYGEGIYIGSAKNNWSKYSNGEPDKSDSNIVSKCKIGPYVAAECIDIKEGTTGGIIKDNYFDATGISGANAADSWIDVKGNYYQVINNNGFNPAGSVLTDGYQVNCAVNGWGSYNEFRNNTSAVNASGYGFNIRLTSSNGAAIGNKVYNNNTVIGAQKGVSNIALSNP